MDLTQREFDTSKSKLVSSLSPQQRMQARQNGDYEVPVLSEPTNPSAPIPESRHLPGKHNQDKHGNDVGGDGWTFKDKDALNEDIVGDFEREVGRPLTDQERFDVIEQLGSNAHAELTKGDVKIIDVSKNGIPREKLQEIADQTAELHAKFPPNDGGRAFVSINAATSFKASKDPDGYVAGDAQAGTGRIRINERVFDEDQPDVGPNWNMPVLSGTDRATYTLHHEWGHANTPMEKESDLFLAWAEHGLDLSSYGFENHHEAYAEAFAEWSLSKGNTDNAATKAYAKRYGWGS